MGKAKVSSGKDLTTGPIGRGILAFAIPLFLGQLLQQLYNVADAWVVGNFANNNAFAAVSSTGSMTFLIIGFFNGVATGGGVVISKYYGAKNYEAVEKAVHTNFLFGIIASILATVVGLLMGTVASHGDEDTGRGYAGGSYISQNIFCRCLHDNHVQYRNGNHACTRRQHTSAVLSCAVLDSECYS